MKKIILAPAVALAFTGLVAAPVAAAETPSTQSAEAKAAEQEKAEKEKAEKEAAAKKAAEKKEAEEKAEAKKKADAKAAAKKKADEKAAEEKKAKEAAEEKDDAKKSAPEPAKKETTPPPAPTPSSSPSPSTEPSEEPTDDPTEEAPEQQADPVLVVPQGEIAAEDLADPSKGVTVTVTGLETGDLLTPLNGLAGDSVEAAGSTATLNLFYDGNAEDLEDGPLPFTIDYQGAAGIETLSGTVNVKAVDDQPVEPIEATLTVDPKEITAEDLANEEKGVKVTVSGVKEGDTITDDLTEKPKTATKDGDYTFTIYYKGNPDNLDPGTVPFTVTIEREGTESKELKGEITVVDDDAVDPIDASLTVDPKEITAEDLANRDKGVKVTVSGVKEGDQITDSLTGETKTATEDGDYTFTLYYKGNPDNLEPGKVPFTVTIDREGTESQELKGEITVIDDKTEAPAEASLTITPKSIEAADFINEKKGVKLSVKDCKPGSDVRFMVTADGNSRVTAYDRTVKADKDGKAWVRVFGTSSNASAYVGSYSVTATCGDDSLKGSFKVTAGSNAGGGDGGGDNGSGAGGNDGGSGSGSYLPRTGVELDGLAAGALLLLVGGAAVTITMRRKKGDFSPSYI
ncbi:hypothetical protein [Brevibacterium casei]|uniref:Uncharacterized protein n=2 Tax=Brevibacterium casei TaxID=33889 RepID=K9AQZ6_9MICO|nr:hypothetical protein [Brevibacterium casei]EKU45062.1 hypothetical protein C272_16098 [Brevibacterium casei S18]QPR38492.1 hypothetical protein I6G94_13045 [Brevibacterium casei]QPR42658.1 hypothetical protein I6G93_10680 [Brevibacterium casei]SMX65201.1 hypothetical protein BC102111_00420 [Brevibacterium casei CIP 102111]